MIQNAILYVLRKKKRTCILFIILTTVLSFLYSSLNIMKLSNNLENNLYKISNTSISITQKDNQNFEINQFKEMENIQEIKEIIPQYDCLAKATNVEVVDGIQKVERENLPEILKNTFSIESTNSTKNNVLFNSGIFTIIDGRHIEKNDREKILIHEELAKKNNLKLHSKINLELIDLDQLDNNEVKKEYEFEVIGIFTGKKQEKYTGLSSDFSENMLFIDYESSQKALNKTQNNKIANKITVYSDNFEESNISFNKIKELKIDLTKYTIEKNDGIFQEVLESVNGIKYIIKIMICSIIISGVIVLSLILILWLRERIHEIGILLSIGTSKLKIIFQFIFELIFISLPSIFVSFFLGNIISDQIIGTFIHNDNSTMIIQNLLKNDDTVSKLITFLQSYGMLLIVIFLSVAISCAMILIKKPKEILSKIS